MRFSSSKIVTYTSCSATSPPLGVSVASGAVSFDPSKQTSKGGIAPVDVKVSCPSTCSGTPAVIANVKVCQAPVPTANPTKTSYATNDFGANNVVITGVNAALFNGAAASQCASYSVAQSPASPSAGAVFEVTGGNLVQSGHGSQSGQAYTKVVVTCVLACTSASPAGSIKSAEISVTVQGKPCSLVPKGTSTVPGPTRVLNYNAVTLTPYTSITTSQVVIYDFTRFFFDW